MTPGFDLLGLQGVTFQSENVTSSIDYGFEVKESKNAAFINITRSDYQSFGFFSLGVGAGTKTITAADAKKLPAAVEGEEITVLAQIFANNLSGNRAARIEIDYYNESGTLIATEILSASTASEWNNIKQVLIVPAGSTRLNVTHKAQCGAGETLKVWFANIRIKR